jgi:hypothetical protein
MSNGSRHRARDVAGKVERVVDDATRPEHPRAYADSDDPAHSTRDLVHEQQREMDHAGVGPGVMTRAQVHGIFGGGLVFGIIGALIGVPFGFIGWGWDVPLIARIGVTALVGLFAGAAIGAVYWGGRLPELEGELTSESNEPSSGSSFSDPSTDDRGRHHGAITSDRRKDDAEETGP